MLNAEDQRPKERDFNFIDELAQCPTLFAHSVTLFPSLQLKSAEQANVKLDRKVPSTHQLEQELDQLQTQLASTLKNLNSVQVADEGMLNVSDPLRFDYLTKRPQQSRHHQSDNAREENYPTAMAPWIQKSKAIGVAAEDESNELRDGQVFGEQAANLISKVDALLSHHDELRRFRTSWTSLNNMETSAVWQNCTQFQSPIQERDMDVNMTVNAKECEPSVNKSIDTIITRIQCQQHNLR